MGASLVISVRWHEGRYHGSGTWPPSPARLFQALVAGVGLRAPWKEEDTFAFSWLEGLEPPLIAAPAHAIGQHLRQFLPNNDLDAKGGDPRNIAKVRGASKDVCPVLFDDRVPVLYAWDVPDADDRTADHIRCAAELLFQLGRGADMAWAWGEVIPHDKLEHRLAEHPGVVLRPARQGSLSLPVPVAGSLDSLHRRYAAYGERFIHKQSGRKTSTILRQVPAPCFALAGYGASPRRRLFELRRVGEDGFAPQPIEHTVAIATAVRDAAADRLASALPGDAGSCAARALTGRPRDGAFPITARVSVIPLGSIGHNHADRQVRRILVEVPDQCPVQVDDIEWALSGLEPAVPGVDSPFAALTTTTDMKMLAHYGVERPSAIWRTITPVALPSRFRGKDEGTTLAGSGERRRSTEQLVARALRQALRHANVSATIEQIRVQKEPFDARGRRAEDFAAARFSAANLWHVEICFGEPVGGPLIVGDGRFLGLGLLAPLVRGVSDDG